MAKAEITEEIVKAAMAAVENDTIQRVVNICREYAVRHTGSRRAKKMAGTAAHLAKIIENMPRKSE